MPKHEMTSWDSSDSLWHGDGPLGRENSDPEMTELAALERNPTAM